MTIKLYHGKGKKQMALKKMFTAKWAEGYRSPANASKVAEEIMGIGDDVTPQQIVSFAESPETELHKCFEWDDRKAAVAYRLHQARMVTNHLVIEVPKQEGKKANNYELRLFHKTASDEGYKPITFIMQNEDEYQILLKKAKAELRGFQNKYRCLAELGEIFELIEKLDN